MTLYLPAVISEVWMQFPSFYLLSSLIFVTVLPESIRSHLTLVTSDLFLLTLIVQILAHTS